MLPILICATFTIPAIQNGNFSLRCVGEEELSFISLMFSAGVRELN